MKERPVDHEVVELFLEGHTKDIGGFTVRRALPSMQRRRVGPFLFFDHMGPAALAPGVGMDVRPHPHVCLATVTYLFEGAIEHRDSLGTHQVIRPGDLNWMVAGRGIVHSERTGAEERRRGPRLHGIQSWVALPLEDEETAPRFEHHPKATLPRVEREGVALDVLAGTAFGARSPVGVLSPTLYVHGTMAQGARFEVDVEHAERAVYVAEGHVSCGGAPLEAGSLAILRPGARAVVQADAFARVMLLGGAHLEGERHLFWNFVASSKERIERAKVDWREGRFPRVPGDEKEFIPLPE